MRWGILATGNIAKKFASTVNEMKAEGQELVAVGSRSMESANVFADAYGIPNRYDSYEALAAAPEVEAVYVATPNSMHYENCKLLLESGKHVLCEKPFMLDREQAEEIYALAQEKGLFIMEALWTRLLPCYEKLEEMIAAGVIGEVQHVKCDYGFVATGARRTRKFKSELGGGALLDIGIYNLGFLQAVMHAEPECFESEVRLNEFGTDEYSRITLTYPGGRTAESVQTIGEVLDRVAVITGTKGSIRLEDFQHAHRLFVTDENGVETVVEAGVDINGFEYQIREVSAMAAAGKSASERYTPAMSMALTSLMDSIRESWKMEFTWNGETH